MEEKIKKIEKLKKSNEKLLVLFFVVLIILIIILPRTNVNKCDSEVGEKYEEQQEVRMFNEKFTPYLGENISAQQAKSLIAAVKTSNGRNAEHQVKNIYIEEINGEVYEGKPTMSRISTKSEYSAEELYDKEGYIKQITITKK